MKAIIFDVDGTLTESMSVDTELYFSSIIEILGPVKIRRNLDSYEHVTDSGILAQVLRDNGIALDNEIAAPIQNVFIERLRTHIDSVAPFPAIDGAVEYLKRAHGSGNTRIAIATGGWRRSALLKLESAGFSIDGVPLATSDDSPIRVDIMRLALEQIGDVDFESITYFGDALWDQRACCHLGWDFVAVGPGLGGIESFDEVLV